MAGWEKRAFPLLAKISLLAILFLIQKDCLTGETAQPVTCMLDKHDKPGLTLRTHTKCWAWWHVPIIVSGQGHPWVSVASWPSLPGKFQPREKLFNSTRWVVPEEGHPRLSSGLYRHTIAYTDTTHAPPST